MSVAQLRLIDLILAMAVYLPVRHSRCPRARFTVLVSCSREIAIHVYFLVWPNLERIFLLLVFIA